LVNGKGQYLERDARITTETNSDSPHKSARFNLAFHSTPSQTWQVDYEGTGNVPESANIGISIGGTGTDWTKPDNNIRRVLTLRNSDGISVVVQWWQAHEQVAFKPSTAPLASSCSVTTPFAPNPLPPAPLPIVPGETGVKLSLPCTNYRGLIFGPPKGYTVFGYTGSVYISQNGNAASITTSAASAVTVFVVPANPDAATKRFLQYKQEFYLVNGKGQYLERDARITNETNNDSPHKSARFNLGFHSSPTQTWQVDYQGTGNVPENSGIGISIGGTGTDWAKPDTNIRRVLTLRNGDGISVVVQWWQAHEQVAFKPSSNYVPSSTCSATSPFTQPQ